MTDKKILMLLSNPFTHDPRVYNEAVALKDAGHEVMVLCWDRTNSHPKTEYISGIYIRRFPHNRFMRLLPLDIMRLRPFWKMMTKEALNIFGGNNMDLRGWTFDVIHCHDLDTLPIGVALKKELGIPLVYDAHEIWGYMVEKDLPKPMANHFLRKEKRLAPKADVVITVSEPIKEYFHSIGCKNVKKVLNCKSLVEYDYSPDPDILRVVYIGGLTTNRFLLECVDVCGKTENVHLTIGGFGKISGEIKEKALAYPNIEFLGLIPMQEVIPITQKSDVVHCVFDPKNKNNSLGCPNKFFEALVLGKSVISSKNTNCGNLTTALDVGIAIDYDVVSYKKALEKLRDNPFLRAEHRKNALLWAEKEYNWDVQSKKLLGVYDELS